MLSIWSAIFFDTDALLSSPVKWLKESNEKRFYLSECNLVWTYAFLQEMVPLFNKKSAMFKILIIHKGAEHMSNSHLCLWTFQKYILETVFKISPCQHFSVCISRFFPFFVFPNCRQHTFSNIHQVFCAEKAKLQVCLFKPSQVIRLEVKKKQNSVQN